MPVDDRACYAKTRCGYALSGDCVASRDGLRQECFDQLFETGEILGGKSILKDDFEDSAVFLERGEVAFRAADVSRKYQFVCRSRRFTEERGSVP